MSAPTRACPSGDKALSTVWRSSSRRASRSQAPRLLGKGRGPVGRLGLQPVGSRWESSWGDESGQLIVKLMKLISAGMGEGGWPTPLFLFDRFVDVLDRSFTPGRAAPARSHSGIRAWRKLVIETPGLEIHTALTNEIDKLTAALTPLVRPRTRPDTPFQRREARDERRIEREIRTTETEWAELIGQR